MATPSVQLDRQKVTQQAHEIVRALLVELANPGLTLPDLAGAHLERDLGLGSLERVELMLRLDAAFGIQLPEPTVAEANTVADLVEAVLAAGGHAIEPRASQANNGSSRGAAPFLPAATEKYPDTRSTLRRVLEGIYGVYALAVFAVLLVPSWLLVHVLPRGRAVWALTEWAIKLLFVLQGVPVRVVGRENLLRGQPCIFVSNHSSYSDVLFLLGYFPHEYRFVAKIEVSSYPFIRAFIRKMNHFAFDRADPRARLEQVKEIEQTLAHGNSVFVFPEGTFAPPPGVRPFQLGAFKAAVATGKPICPVAVRGAREILRDETMLPRPGSVTITICPPILPGKDGWQEIVRLREATRAAIARHAGEPML
jgi:1-acyl-sn-glycerol-3-phosphate acyltransferase